MAAAAVIGAATIADSQVICPEIVQSLDKAAVAEEEEVAAAETATTVVSRGIFPAIAPKGVNSQLDRPSSGLRIGVLIRGSKVNKLSLFFYTLKQNFYNIMSRKECGE